MRQMAMAVSVALAAVGGAMAQGKTWTGAAFGEAKRFEPEVRSAMTLAIEDGRLYAGAGDSLYVFDISNPLSPRRLGRAKGIMGTRQVAVQKAFAYVTSREGGLSIVDCTDPSKPRVRSRFDSCELATGVDVAGDVCFCGQRQNGVEFIDVSDPDHPRHIAMRKTGESQSVHYRDGWLYSGEWGSGQVTVFDAHDMRNIREVKLVDLYGYGDGLWSQGHYLFAARGHHSLHRKVTGGVMTAEMKRFGGPKEGGGMGHGLDIFDIADPSAPKRVGSVDYPPFYARGLDMWTPRTSANSDVVFASQTHNGIFAVDCSDPAKPKVLDRWVFPVEGKPQWPSCCIGSIAVGDGCVYVAGQGCGVLAIPAKFAAKETFRQGPAPVNHDYREPYSTDAAAFHVWHPAKPGQARGVALKGDLVYAACGDAGLHVLKIRPEGGFEKVGELSGRDRVFDVQVEGNRLYTAEGREGWAVYEMEDAGTSFREISRRKWIDDKKDPAIWVWKPKPGLVALSTRRNGAWLYADDNIRDERPLGTVSGCPGWDKYLMDQAIGGGRWLAFNAANSYLRWFDLSTPPPYKVISTENNRISLSNGICRFSDDLALATCGDGYLFLKPGECDPADGSKWKTLKFPGKRMNGIPRVSPEGLVVLTCRIRRTIGLWDFANPEKPKFLNQWTVSGNPDIAAFHKGKIIVPCGHQGVLMQK